MVAAMTVPSEDTNKYGIFSFNGAASNICIPVNGIVEKPALGQAPLSVAAVGCYILQPIIFDILEQTLKGAGDEVQLTDAISIATRSLPLMAFRFSGDRFDCGTHDGLLAASNARQHLLWTARMNAVLPVSRPAGKSENAMFLILLGCSMSLQKGST